MRFLQIELVLPEYLDVYWGILEKIKKHFLVDKIDSGRFTLCVDLGSSDSDHYYIVFPKNPDRREVYSNLDCKISAENLAQIRPYLEELCTALPDSFEIDNNDSDEPLEWCEDRLKTLHIDGTRPPQSYMFSSREIKNRLATKYNGFDDSDYGGSYFDDDDYEPYGNVDNNSDDDWNPDYTACSSSDCGMCGKCDY